MTLSEIQDRIAVVGANLMHYQGTKAEREAAAIAYTLIGKAWNVINDGINCANDPQGLPPGTITVYGLNNEGASR